MWIYIRFVQKILIAIFLSITFVLVFPITWLFMALFSSQGIRQGFKKAETYWHKAPILPDDPGHFENQS